MRAHGYHDCRCSRQGLNHSSLFEWNMVNPAFRLREAGDSARSVEGMAGGGNREKAKAGLEAGGQGLGIRPNRANGPTSSGGKFSEQTFNTFLREEKQMTED